MAIMQLYEKLDTSDYKKIFMTGDIHGKYDLLMARLQDAKFDFDTDLLITTGDLIDRGEDSLKCLRLINEKWFKTIMGNHEHMAIESLMGNKSYINCWMSNGGGWFTELNKIECDELYKLLFEVTKFPIVMEATINNRKYVFVHADYPKDKYVFGQKIDLEQCIWSRDRVDKQNANFIEGADVFVFGHTPFKKIHTVANRMYIDTGSCFYNNVVLTRLDNL